MPGTRDAGHIGPVRGRELPILPREARHSHREAEDSSLITKPEGGSIKQPERGCIAVIKSRLVSGDTFVTKSLFDACYVVYSRQIV